MNILVKYAIFIACLMFPLAAEASFIESTLGTAVVNDAAAAYFNPAGLVYLKNSQIIPLGSIAYTSSRFSGTFVQRPSGYTITGSSPAGSTFYFPSLYAGIPLSDRCTLGIAVVSNLLNRDIESNSVLRYAQASNDIQNIDLVAALGIRLTDALSIGASVNLSYADFLLKPVSGAPGLNIPDTQSRNDSNGTGIGGDVGVQYRLSKATIIGFNYRTSITYPLSGVSTFESIPAVVSTNYRFTYWAPARSVATILHFVTPRLGFIGTVQRINTSIYHQSNIYNIAALVGGQPRIVNTTITYNMRDTWLMTLGNQFKITPYWVIRFAVSYNQASGNRYFQVTNGDSYIVGMSTGYDINKTFSLDASYAHAFFKDATINVANARALINGINSSAVNSVSLKLTVNML